jgi:hypothetical protein
VRLQTLLIDIAERGTLPAAEGMIGEQALL